MKKRLVCLLLLLMLPLSAQGEGVVLRTVSSFAGADAAAEAYVELLRAFEMQTGCVIEDSSATSDEAWKANVLFDFMAGNEPDVLFFFAANADSAPLLYKVVPIAEINAAYPDAHLPENAALAEADGRVYAIPVRAFWEGLFVNADLFEQYGLALPDTWERLEAAIQKFNEVGIVPISVSLSDIPHYLAEFSLLACGGGEALTARPQNLAEVPQSWYDGMALIRSLSLLGAFAPNANATTEANASRLFREKKAAMQIDGSWFANSIPPQNMDSTLVMPIPSYAESGEGYACIGGISMGFYLTRRAWEDENKRDMAVQLLTFLTNEENAVRLGGYEYTGRLLESAYELVNNAEEMLSPLQDAMNKEARESWLLSCIPALADGSMTPEECWEKVMALSPFTE